jgi:hypothetical protein
MTTVAAPEYFTPRGIGSEWNLTCLVTGETANLMPNLSGFVESKEAGERVVAMFNGRARLDYRASEPSWIQVKVGVLPQYILVLELIHHYTQEGVICPRMIQYALTRERRVREGEKDRTDTADRLLPLYLALKYRPQGAKWDYSIAWEFERIAEAAKKLGEGELSQNIFSAIERNKVK